MVLDFEPPRTAGFQSHFNATKWSDITLITGTARIRIRAHRLVLSEYSRWLAISCADPNVTAICIPRWESQIIHFVMRYMYTGSLDNVGFETMMDIYECAKDLEIQSLMDAVLHTVLLDSGKWEQVLSDRYKMWKLLSLIFDLTTEKERRSGLYPRIFKLIAAKMYQDNLLQEDWFVDLIKGNSELGLELLKAPFEKDQNAGTISCYRRGCRSLIGEWNPCFECDHNCHERLSAWDDDENTWANSRPDDAWDKKYGLDLQDNSDKRDKRDIWEIYTDENNGDELDSYIREKKTRDEEAGGKKNHWDSWAWDPLDTTWQDAEGWGPDDDELESNSWETPDGSDCYGLGF
ncbi:hypothetical protein TWF694_006651 [Orbilia ellipsospora]|uniref:BTB domain-containing protein n=1 Tax=Orbilia ellipsospora TaxID=2528407 RepID=A0AAV9XKW0_9PEZI